MVTPSYTWRLAELGFDVDADGHLPAENLSTAETDDTLVLAPDGSGGVEFRAESGGGSATLAGLTDVDLTSPGEHDQLAFNGSVWVNSAAHWKYVIDSATGTILMDGATGAGIEAWE